MWKTSFSPCRRNTKRSKRDCTSRMEMQRAVTLAATVEVGLARELAVAREELSLRSRAREEKRRTRRASSSVGRRSDVSAEVRAALIFVATRAAQTDRASRGARVLDRRGLELHHRE